MRRRAVLVLIVLLAAFPAAAQTLDEHLAAMADHAEKSADLAAAAKSSFDNGWMESGCTSMDSSLAEMQASLDELNIMENMVNADTTMSAADRDDWLGHIRQQSADAATALSVGRQRRAEYCA